MPCAPGDPERQLGLSSRLNIPPPPHTPCWFLYVVSLEITFAQIPLSPDSTLRSLRTFRSQTEHLGETTVVFQAARPSHPPAHCPFC